MGGTVSGWLMNGESIAMELRQFSEPVYWQIKSLSIDAHGLRLERVYDFPAPLMWMEMKLRLQGLFSCSCFALL